MLDSTGTKQDNNTRVDFLEIKKPCASKDAVSQEYRDDGPNTLPNHISNTQNTENA